LRFSCLTLKLNITSRTKPCKEENSSVVELSRVGRQSLADFWVNIIIKIFRMEETLEGREAILAFFIFGEYKKS